MSSDRPHPRKKRLPKEHRVNPEEVMPEAPPEPARPAPLARLRLDPKDPLAPELTIEAGRLKRAVDLSRRKGVLMPFKDAWTYKVRSQRGSGYYVVEEKAGLWFCDCPDASPLRPCVHVLTVLLRRGLIPYPDEDAEEEAPRAEGAGFDWAAYRKAELAIPTVLPRLAFRLFELLPQPGPRYGPGRPAVPQTDALLCALLWATNQKNMRREQETRDRLMAEGLLSRHIACNSVSRALTDADTTPLLEEALRRSREPFASLDPDASPLTLAVVGDTFAIDSTGFTPSRRGHYNHEKHGPDKPIPWLKCHLMISTKAHLVTSARITRSTGAGSGDTSQFAPLLEETRETFPIGAVVGDGAYASRKNVALVRDAGGQPFFPPRDDAITQQRGVEGWGDMVAFFRMHRPAFDAIYHRRSIVESVNSAIKRRFGETLRSRTETSRVNELLCKLVAYNLTVLIQNLHYLHAEDEWLDRVL